MSESLGKRCKAEENDSNDLEAEDEHPKRCFGHVLQDILVNVEILGWLASLPKATEHHAWARSIPVQL
jgi:hypothetical protein